MEIERKPTKTKGVIEALPPKIAFWAGVVVSAAIFAVIAMLIMATSLFGDDADSATSKTAKTNVNAAAPAAAAPSGPTGTVQLAAVTADDHMLGDPDAEVTIVEYSDLECPFCKRFHPTMQQVVEEYDGKVNWVYRHFPLDSLHSKARKEAEATECATELGGNDAFWEYTDLLFEETPSNNGLNLESLPDYAEQIGLDRAKFTECLDSGKYADAVASDLADAQSAGGTGTPYSVIVVGDQRIPISGALPFETIAAQLDQVLQ